MEKKFERNTFTLFKVGAACSNEPMRRIYVSEGTMRIMRHPMNDRMFAKDFPTQLRTKIHTTKILPSVAGLRFRRIDDYTYGVYRYCAESQKFDILAYQFVFDAPLPMDYDLGKLVEQKSMPEKSVHDMAEKSGEIEITADMLETLKSMTVYDLLKTIKQGTVMSEKPVVPGKSTLPGKPMLLETPAQDEQPERVCLHCGKPLHGHPNKKYCSAECARAEYNMTEKVCPHCGKVFRGHRSKKYCCDQCKRSEQHKRLYMRKKYNGQCIACGKPAHLTNGARICPSCNNSLPLTERTKIINEEYARRMGQNKTA